MDVMAKLFNICDPLKSPPEGAYVDLSSGRGDAAVVSMLDRRIHRTEAQTHLLFSGHPGSGKSTELLRLCERLKNPQGDSVDRFFPVYMDADDYINRHDVEVMEILLALVGSVAGTLRDEKNIHLESSYFRSRWEELRDIALTPVELEKVEFSLPEIGKFTTKLKQANVGYRREVRKKLTPRLPSLLDETNLILARTRLELKKRGYRDLVLVVDNLEKLRDIRFI
jgi:DNA polymerase III delta prime subunit